MNVFILKIISLFLLFSCKKENEPHLIQGTWNHIQNDLNRSIEIDSEFNLTLHFIHPLTGEKMSRKNYKIEFRNEKLLLIHNQIVSGELILKNQNFLYLVSYKTNQNKSGSIDDCNLYIRTGQEYIVPSKLSIFIPNIDSSIYLINFKNPSINYEIIETDSLIVFENRAFSVNHPIDIFFYANNPIFFLNDNGKQTTLEDCSVWIFNKEKRQTIELKSPNTKFVYLLRFNPISHYVLEHKYNLTFDKESFVFFVGTISEIKEYLKLD